jgi:hypothetical protein
MFSEYSSFIYNKTCLQIGSSTVSVHVLVCGVLPWRMVGWAADQLRFVCAAPVTCMVVLLLQLLLLRRCRRAAVGQP